MENYNVQPPQYNQMGNNNIQPPQYNQYDQMSRPASAAGRSDTPELQQANGLAIASLVCGIAGLPLAFCYGIGAFLGGAGLAMAIISGKKGNVTGKRKTGMILSIISIAIGLVILFIWISLYSLAYSASARGW